MAEFDGHCIALQRRLRIVRPPLAAPLQVVDDLLGDVVLVVLGEDVGRAEACRRAAMLPSATTPCPSRNRSGRMPVKCAVISPLPSLMTKLLSSPFFFQVPSLTSPPSRIGWPAATCLAAASLGRIEEHDLVAERHQDQRQRQRQHHADAADSSSRAACGPCLALERPDGGFAGHFAPPSSFSPACAARASSSARSPASG